jgi:mono/diheme cytochrome c family protein
MRRMAVFLLVVASLVVPIPAFAQPHIGNGHSPGRQVAVEVCSACHQVSEGASLPSQRAPRFVDIANMPSTTALSLKVFLRSNHKRMPNFTISVPDAEDVIDYILSLKHAN